ncbi:hypothetical protein B0A52_03769 [Exophiala mesophila]|uniref:Uncharacterized protein n=1 Tax=Exophiala mesophila TaxID=212818 RepID=A0A438N7P3_EXOME|nr:hypothetical protein B0A52_03769 [Exophiala mesophila]
MTCGDIDLDGKVVVITGGGSGINLAFAKLCRLQGAKVIIGDIRLTEDGQNFVDGTSSDKAIFVECNVRKRKDLENLITTSREKFGTAPDVYIAGAGVFEPSWSNWWDDEEENEYAEIEINVNHALKFSRIATRALLGENKRGAVLIVSSLAGYMGTFSAPLYCASKHAVIGFVRSMAELDRLASIKIVAVAPGMVQTPLWTDHPEKMKQYGYDPETAVTAEAVAEAMIDLVKNGSYQGGACLEVSINGTRTLGTFNIAPPKGGGTIVPQEVRDQNYAPLIAILDSERRQV